MWHPGRVDVIGFVLCCRSDRGKIDHGGVRCVCVCESVHVCVHAWEGVGAEVGVLEKGTGWKGQAVR